MAYDEELADRVRALLGGESRLTEQPMFGGLCFLVGGNLAVAISGRGRILARVGPDDAEGLVAAGEAEESGHGWSAHASVLPAKERRPRR